MTDALVPVVETPAVDAAAAAEAASGVVPAGPAAIALPRVIVEAGPAAVGKFVEFFAGRIANERTRAAYARAARQFLGWCEARGLRLEAVSPLHVAAYIRTHPGSAPTVKQHLAAIRMLCDWLVVSQVLPGNPAAAVRGPKHVVNLRNLAPHAHPRHRQAPPPRRRHHLARQRHRRRLAGARHLRHPLHRHPPGRWPCVGTRRGRGGRRRVPGGHPTVAVDELVVRLAHPGTGGSSWR